MGACLRKVVTPAASGRTLPAPLRVPRRIALRGADLHVGTLAPARPRCKQSAWIRPPARSFARLRNADFNAPEAPLTVSPNRPRGTVLAVPNDTCLGGTYSVGTLNGSRCTDHVPRWAVGCAHIRTRGDDAPAEAAGASHCLVTWALPGNRSTATRSSVRRALRPPHSGPHSA